MNNSIENKLQFSRKFLNKFSEILEEMGYYLTLKKSDMYDSEYGVFLGTNFSINVESIEDKKQYKKLTLEEIESGKFLFTINDDAYAYAINQDEIDVYLPDGYNFFTKIQFWNSKKINSFKMRKIIYSLFDFFQGEDRELLVEIYNEQFKEQLKNPNVFLDKNGNKKQNDLELELVKCVKINPVKDGIDHLFNSGFGVPKTSEVIDGVLAVADFFKNKPLEYKESFGRILLPSLEFSSRKDLKLDLAYTFLLEILDNNKDLVKEIVKNNKWFENYFPKNVSVIKEGKDLLYKVISVQAEDVKAKWAYKWWQLENYSDMLNVLFSKVSRKCERNSGINEVKDFSVEKKGMSFQILIGYEKIEEIDLNKIKDLIESFMNLAQTIDIKNFNKKSTDEFAEEVDKLINYWELKNKLVDKNEKDPIKIESKMKL